MGHFVHQYDFTILESHLDTFGHVNNATYLQIYEEARWDMITARGYGLKRVQKDQIGPVILEIVLKFKKELLNRDKIIIESEFRSFKNKLVGILDQRMINEKGEVCSTVELHVGLFDMNERRLIQPFDDWLAAIGVDKALI